MANKICNNCNKEIDEKEDFCPSCGEKYIEDNSKKCPKCGNKINKKDAFCQNCGTKLQLELSKEEINEKISNKRCPNCNDKIVKGEKYCQKCGTKLEIEEEVPVKEEKKETGKRICPTCGNEINDKDAYCQKCGSRMDIILPLSHIEEKISNKRCPNCNDKIEEGEIFCQKCGTRLDTYEKIDTTHKKEKGIIKQNNKSTKTKPFIVIIISILLISIVVLSAMIITEENRKKDKNEDDPIKDIDNKIADKEIKIYYDGYTFSTTKTSNAIEIGTIKTVDEDIIILDGRMFYSINLDNQNTLLLIKDDNHIKLYSLKDNKSETLLLNSNYESYHLIISENFIPYGIEFMDGIEKTTDKYGGEVIESFTKSGYYNLETNKILYANQEYYDFEYVSPYKIKAKNGKSFNKKIDLLDNNEERVYLTRYIRDDYDCGGITYENIGKHFIIEGEKNCITGEIINGTLYSENMNLIERNVNSNNIEEYNNILYIIKNNIIYKYTIDGKEISKTEKYDQVLDVINDYFIVIDNNQLKIKNEKNLDIVLLNWKSHYIYHKNLSGYYDESKIIASNDDVIGIYLVVETNENGLTSGVEYYYNPKTQEIKEYALDEIK